MEVTKTTRQERGWAGHFIASMSCAFRRNTLLARGKNKIVISTVGSYRSGREEKLDTIGAGGRYYETMAFKAHKEGSYWEANVSEQLSFDSPWSICYEKLDDMPEDVDLKADTLHETVVKEFMEMKRWLTKQ